MPAAGPHRAGLFPSRDRPRVRLGRGRDGHRRGDIRHIAPSANSTPDRPRGPASGPQNARLEDCHPAATSLLDRRRRPAGRPKVLPPQPHRLRPGPSAKAIAWLVSRSCQRTERLTVGTLRLARC